MSAQADILIREARSGDVDRLCDLLGILFALESDFVCDRSRQQRGLRILMGNGGCRVMVAECGSRVVGMCTGQIVVSTAEGGPALLVEDVVVDLSWRRRGVARALLGRLDLWAAAHGVARMQLFADGDNIAGLEFYRRLNWRRTRLVCLRKMVDGT